jgi:hypothetical protein
MSERIEVDGAKPADSGRVDLLNGEMLQAGADALDRFVAWEPSNDEERYACIEAVWRAMRERAPTAALAAQGQGEAHVATDTCRCGAPCRKEVLMRGGDYGWGDDASRTVLRYAPPASPAGVPKGWKLVPIEPTWDMVLAHGNCDEIIARRDWRQMLAAAPSAPESNT